MVLLKCCGVTLHTQCQINLLSVANVSSGSISSSGCIASEFFGAQPKSWDHEWFPLGFKIKVFFIVFEIVTEKIKSKQGNLHKLMPLL